MSHPHGCVSWNILMSFLIAFQIAVTPSRVCELKSEVPDINWFTLRHTLTGVWVEIMVWNAELPILLSHTLTGVWVEMVIMPLLAVRSSSHPHGCVSWNEPAMLHKEAILVTPSRVCELKYQYQTKHRQQYQVTPSRVCELKFNLLLNNSAVSNVTPSRVCELKFNSNYSRLCGNAVTPSRVCELKWYAGMAGSPREWSHPHGCVSWNIAWIITVSPAIASHPHGCVSWNATAELHVPKKHGCVSWNDISAVVIYLHIGVTPSRVCELKSTNIANRSCAIMSHPHGCVSWNNVISTFWNDLVLSHPHGCVSWNMSWRYEIMLKSVTPSRVCELKFNSNYSRLCGNAVTPSRVCELKWYAGMAGSPREWSHPHGCVSWNIAWIITVSPAIASHPHGCVSWNATAELHVPKKHGCVSWNDISAVVIYLHIGVTPSRVCELKSTNIANRSCAIMSHPHGCVSWNNVISTFWNDLVLSHPHGCVSWNSHQLWYLLFWYRSHPHGCVSWNFFGVR